MFFVYKNEKWERFYKKQEVLVLETNITSLYLSKSLKENIKMFEEIFENDNSYVVRKVRDNIAVMFFDGMVSSQILAENVVSPLLKEEKKQISAEYLSQYVIEVNDSKVTDNMTDIMNAFLYGDSLVLIDGDSRGILVNTKGFLTRSIDEPDSEKVLSGSKEGFIESFMMNLAMIRRRIKNPNLKFKFINVGKTTKTTAVICYIKGLVDENVLKTFEERVKKFEIDSALDTNYIVETIKDSEFSPFATVGTTERPDVFVAKMLEGRVGLVLDGTPVAITAPHILAESFQVNDDYYINFWYANASRMLRIFGFLFNITIPAVFLAMITYHQELIPTKLLFSISSARQSVPFPAFLEMFGLVILFEVLKEAGTRTPSGVGQALSIVGAVVLGQSAVEARFVSAPIVIIVAFSGITALVVPKLKVPSLVLRLAYLMLATVLGVYGIIFGVALTMLHLCSIRSFGVPYVANLTSIKIGGERDILVRFPWNKMKPSNRFLSTKNKKYTSGD